MATKELLAARLDNIDRKLVVKVGGKDVRESKDEKLLGMIMSNDLTWHTHLYGNKLKGKDKLVGLVLYIIGLKRGGTREQCSQKLFELPEIFMIIIKMFMNHKEN